MALVQCPKCGKNFSDKESDCPECGCSLTQALICSPKIQQSVLDIVDNMKDKQADMLSTLVDAKEIEILGSKLKFPSSYFAEGFIKTYFNERISKLKENTLRNCKKLDVSDREISTGLVQCVIIQGTMQSSMILNEFSNKVKLDDDKIFQTISDCLEEAYSALESDLNDIGNMFTEVDLGIESTKLENQLQKVSRRRWMVGGIGLSGMFTGAITGAVLDAGSGLAYDAVGGILVANKRRDAKKTKALLLDQAMSIIEEFYEYLKEYAPAVVLASIYQKYPYSIWEKDEKEEKAARKRYLSEKVDNKKADLVKLLLRQNPQNLGNYQYVFDEICKEDKSLKQTDTDNLFIIYGWFNLNENRLKESILKGLDRKYDIEDLQGYEEITEAEKLLKSSDKSRSRKRRDALMKGCINNIKEYTAKEVNAALNGLHYYEDVCSSDVTSLKNELIKRIFNRFSIKIGSKSKSDVEYNIKQLERLQNEGYELDFSDYLQEQKGELNNILEKEERKRKEEEIKKRTLKVISDYNATTHGFTYIRKVFDSLEDKEAVSLKMDELTNLCEKIDINLEDQEWNESVQRVNSFCEKNHFCEGLLDSLNYQRADAEKASRTFEGTVYETKEEAEIVKRELVIIEDAYKKDRDTKRAFCNVLKYRFQSQKAKQMILDKEKQLLSEYQSLKERNSAMETMTSTVGAGSALIVAIVVTVVAAIIGLAIIPIPIGPIIAICVIVAVWKRFKEKTSDIASNVSDLAYVKKKIAEFESLFNVVDGHIVLKTEKTQMPTAKKAEDKQYQSNISARRTDIDITPETKPHGGQKSIGVQYCAFCGKQIAKTAKFCNFCGEAVRE